MEKFPNEGKISTITLNEQQIKYLEEYLIKEKGITDSKMSKSGSSGIGWNNNSYWYIKDFSKSGKNEYAYFQISKFIESKDEFKKGDYIVLISTRQDDSYKINHCYKQRENYRHILTELDSKGSKTNGWVFYSFTDTNWRYATPQEIAEYDKIGKPYDVTILKSELTKKDLQRGVVYFVKHKENDTVYLIKQGCIPYVRLHNKQIGHDFVDLTGSYIYELATKEQIQHYNDCIKAYKYVEPNTKSIEPWSVGTYVVALKNEVHSIRSFNKGDIAIITGNNEITLLSDNSHGWFCDCKNSNTNVKWFATKSEAEEFAKTLVEVKPEPIKVYDYEVVHCTTQEEWDYAIKQLGYTKCKNDWDLRSHNCINLLGDLSAKFDYYQDYNAKFYSFKEWCDMNNFEFKSKPQFEVGKWYKNNAGRYTKFLKLGGIDNDCFYGTEHIYGNPLELHTSNSTNGTWLFYLHTNPVLLEDLSEIQQCLPEGHVDKIKSEYIPQVGDWIVVIEGKSGDSETFKGQCKKVTNSNSTCIEIEGGLTGLHTNKTTLLGNIYSAEFRKAQPHEIPNVKPNLEKGKYYQITYSDYPEYLYVVIGNGDLKTLNCLDDKRKVYYRTNIFSGINIQIQPASEEQIAWLDRCIAANKFVPKELSKDELLEIAKQKYPVGTKFIDCEFGDIVEVLDNSNGYMSYHKPNNSINTYTTKGEIGKLIFNDVYLNGKWAEIVDKPLQTANTMAERIAIHSTYGIMNGGSNTWVHVGNPCNEIPKCEIELQLKGKVQLDTRINHIQSTTTNLYKKSKLIIFNNN